MDNKAVMITVGIIGFAILLIVLWFAIFNQDEITYFDTGNLTNGEPAQEPEIRTTPRTQEEIDAFQPQTEEELILQAQWQAQLDLYNQSQLESENSLETNSNEN